MAVDRAVIFAAVRRLVGRGLTQAEVDTANATIDRALAARAAESSAHPHRLGSLSEHYESGGRGAGTVSGGQGDPGGVSYGLYQLASKTGTAKAFVLHEGAPWAAQLSAAPGTAAFTAAWKAIAASEGAAFGAAQHAFIKRSHYAPAVAAVLAANHFDLNSRPNAVRDAVWSTAVQHASAPGLLKAAVTKADPKAARGTLEHDSATIEAIYLGRTALVSTLAQNASKPAVHQTMLNIIANRYPDELAAALAFLLPRN